MYVEKRNSKASTFQQLFSIFQQQKKHGVCQMAAKDTNEKNQALFCFVLDLIFVPTVRFCRRGAGSAPHFYDWSIIHLYSKIVACFFLWYAAIEEEEDVLFF